MLEKIKSAIVPLLLAQSLTGHAHLLPSNYWLDGVSYIRPANHPRLFDQCTILSGASNAEGKTLPYYKILDPRFHYSHAQFKGTFKDDLAAIAKDPENQRLYEKMIEHADNVDPELAQLMRIGLTLKNPSLAKDKAIEMQRRLEPLIALNLPKLVAPEILALGLKDPMGLELIIDKGLFVGVQLNSWTFYSAKNLLDPHLSGPFYRLTIKPDRGSVLPTDLAQAPFMNRVRILDLSGYFVYANAYKEGDFIKFLSSSSAGLLTELTLSPYTPKLHKELYYADGVVSNTLTKLNLRRELPLPYIGSVKIENSDQTIPMLMTTQPEAFTQFDWILWLAKAKKHFPALRTLQIQHESMDMNEQQMAVTAGKSEGIEVLFYSSATR